MISVSRRAVVIAAAAAVSLPLYVVFPTAVGLNGDLARYGTNGIQLLCGDGGRVWGNYRFEPVFVAVWWALAKFWAVAFGPGAELYCRAANDAVFWMPIVAVAVLVAAQIFVIRVLGAGAIAFHLVFCLDTALMMMPFNLIRQFVAVVLVLGLVSLMVRDRLSPPWFVAALAVPALVHWSAWALFLAGVISLLVIDGRRLSAIRIKRSRWSLAAIVVVVALIVAVAYGFAAYLVPRVQNTLFGPVRFQGFGIEPTIRGILSPITLAVVLFAYVAGRRLDAGFARTFLIGIAGLYCLVAASGVVPAMERLRMLVLPVTYFVFLLLLHRRAIHQRWQVVNIVFVLFAVFNFSWHALISQPFSGRPSFLQLLE